MPIKSSDTPENRKYKRVSRPYSVRLRILRSGDAAAWDMVLIKNISAGGLLFHYPQSVAPGTTLILKINVAMDEKPIECTGRVLRCEEIEKNQTYFSVAVKFIEISKKDADLIDREAQKFE